MEQFKNPALILPAAIAFAAGMLLFGQVHASQQYATPDPNPTITYEDGSWVSGDQSGCLEGGLCND